MRFNEQRTTYYRKQFLGLRNVPDLAKILNTDTHALFSVASNPQYRRFQINKKSGGVREITVPNDSLGSVQKWLNFFLQSVYSSDILSPVHGFVRSSEKYRKAAGCCRSIISNAAMHLQKKYVLNIDLADFFSSVSASRVKHIFTNYPFYFDLDLATCLALICTYEKKLPTGSPTSPMLSNFACLSLDRHLFQLAADHQLTYTRYADDISFSSQNLISDLVIEKIKSVIVASKFQINGKKWRVQSQNSTQTVTGIKVNQKLNVDRKYIRKLRAVFHDIETNGISRAAATYFSNNKRKNPEKEMLQSISGKIDFIRQVKGENDPVYLRYFDKLRIVKSQTVA